MWSYFGTKTDQAKHYPVPAHSKIIEPFAGTAKYSLRYWDRDVILIDKYNVIISIWKWLQQCSSQDILKLPNLKEGEKLSDLNWDCIEQRWFMGFIIAAGDASPRNKVSSRMSTHRPKRQRSRLKKIASDLEKIRHWEIRLGDYKDLINEEATWFIDPPYQHGGQHYKHGNKGINFLDLSKWCKSRIGQTIVCENTKADWLPFKPMIKTIGSIHKTTEAIWSNQHTVFDNEQLTMFNDD